MHYTDWIGYHFVDYFLQRGHKVYGIEGEAGNPVLKDFFVRNSNFKTFESRVDINYDYIICIGNLEGVPNLDSDYFFLINGKNNARKEDVLLIDIPNLFGEFMPMTDEGYYDKEKWIEFSAETFQNDGVYIAHFVEEFIDLLEKLTENINLKSIIKEKGQNEEVSLEKSFFLRENVPIGKELAKVRKHYKKFKALYPDIEK